MQDARLSQIQRYRCHTLSFSTKFWSPRTSRWHRVDVSLFYQGNCLGEKGDQCRRDHHQPHGKDFHEEKLHDEPDCAGLGWIKGVEHYRWYRRGN
jgi:hypothetical protein